NGRQVGGGFRARDPGAHRVSVSWACSSDVRSERSRRRARRNGIFPRSAGTWVLVVRLLLGGLRFAAVGVEPVPAGLCAHPPGVPAGSSARSPVREAPAVEAASKPAGVTVPVV